MRDYHFRVLIDGNICGEGYGSGHSAIEAFESGIENDSVFIPNGQEVEILALSSNNIGIRFKAIQGL